MRRLLVLSILVASISLQPQRGLAQGGKARFAVPEGFRVETVVAEGTKIAGDSNARFNLSLVNMCFDAKGRLLLSQEGGPIVLASDPNKDGVFQTLTAYCDQVTNCHGMCWAHDALYLVGNGPDGTGLYRCRDTLGKDCIDKVEKIFKFKGGMGEHGPHAVIHGPDDKLYLVIGNHASAEVEKLADNSPLTRWPTGGEGPDQGKPGTTEDVLLPRLNDANGHAANKLAPGGTIWRIDLDGKNPALVTAGFRNHFDVAFNPAGELFTFDSDMEWDVGLPWYRHVRVCHCPPGADFLWRTGAANTPDYYADSLPPLVETGRGSPTGVEFYDHSAFPAKYRGAFLMSDWSIGVLWAVHLERSGASFKGTAEKFCTGAPMPISDCAVGPDGAIYFTLGGRGTQGSVQRIVHQSMKPDQTPGERDQPLAAWSQLRYDGANAQALIVTPATPAERKARDVYLLGINGSSGFATAITASLRDADPLVARLACDACIRQGFEPAVRDLKPLLAGDDRFLRTAARLVLQRIEPRKWADLVGDASDRIAHEAIIALCKIGKANDYAEPIFERLHDNTPGATAEQLLDWARTVQLALVHVSSRPPAVRGIAVDCRELFPHKDKFVNRELAILLAEFGRAKEINRGAVAKLLAALQEAKDDREQQIHLFYCIRVLKDDWSAEQKRDLLAWYESTRTWTGGNSFTGFLQNILGDLRDVWTAPERQALVAAVDSAPNTALAMLRFAAPDELPGPAALMDLYQKVNKGLPRANELKTGLAEALGKSRAPEAPAALRKLADVDPAQKLTVARALARLPTAENLPYVVQGLSAAPGPIVSELLDALKKNPAKPKPDDAAAFRGALASAAKLQTVQKWKVVELLRYWTGGKSFGGEKKEEWKSELASWGRWYVQTFPKEPRLPDVGSDQPAESKYKLAELAAYLEKDPRGSKGDVEKGKLIFTKALCIKCHKFGTEGEGIGPDLTMLSKRFKRSEILESILDPSKVISDQYRSSTIFTTDGRTLIGLAAEQGGMITVLLNDGSKIAIKSTDVESRLASLVSVMPEKLLDYLTLEEIVDLFVYLDSAPAEKK